MLVQPECLACFVRQAVDAAMLATDDPQLQRQVALEACRLVADSRPDVTPVYVAMEINDLVQRMTQAGDFYAETRRQLNDQAMALWPLLDKAFADSDDWVEQGVRLAIAGNILDLGAVSREHLADARQELERCLSQPFAREDLAELREALHKAQLVLYIGDNAGEIVFDKAFIAQMRRHVERVVFAVRGAPVINDITLADAEQVGMAEVAEVISSGFPGPGAELHLSSQEFRDLFAQADVVIAKGQGNYESLSGMEGPIYLLLQAKCRAIARHIGVPIRSLLAMRASSAPR